MSKRSEQGLSLGSNMLWNSMGSFFYFACQYLPTILVVRMAADLNASGAFNYAMNTTNVFLTIAVYGMRAYQVILLMQGDDWAEKLRTLAGLPEDLAKRVIPDDVEPLQYRQDTRNA